MKIKYNEFGLHLYGDVKSKKDECFNSLKRFINEKGYEIVECYISYESMMFTNKDQFLLKKDNNFFHLTFSSTGKEINIHDDHTQYRSYVYSKNNDYVMSLLKAKRYKNIKHIIENIPSNNDEIREFTSKHTYYNFRRKNKIENIVKSI